MFFQYGDTETEYLKRKDPRLGALIDRIGHVGRAVDPDLFSAVVHHIVGQQISTKAQATIWNRMRDALGTVDAPAVLAAGPERLQAFGISFRKAAYILEFAEQVETGRFDLADVANRTDSEAIRMLSGLKGIGVWTAEMILLFCMQRPTVLSAVVTRGRRQRPKAEKPHNRLGGISCITAPVMIRQSARSRSPVRTAGSQGFGSMGRNTTATLYRNR